MQSRPFLIPALSPEFYYDGCH